jgi:NADH:ubiquinone oxidoreductase subunit F (NADH-binding)
MQITQNTNFESFKKAASMPPEEVIQIIKDSNLKGRGGANFSTGIKWECTRNCDNSDKILICNADEGEPGTFKDKMIMTKNPDILIEGIAIAAYAIDAKRCFIYLRGEYAHLRKNLEDSIAKHAKELEKINLNIDIIMGAGAYICGDETAIMNSIQELRGEPRTKPPYPVEKGLCDCPTSINNVETLANVPLILEGGWKDMRLFSLSGNLENPGVYELPLGVTAGDLISLGKPKTDIKALFFGCAGGCIPYAPETKLDPETINKMGAMLGSCTVIAVGKEQSIVKICRNIAEFFVHESCGKCTPCREGNYHVLQILDKILEKTATADDFTALEDLASFINKTSLCGLGQASNIHIKTALKYFREEFR